MTLEEARRACEEGLLCYYHLPKHGPYIPAEDIPIYITAVYDDFLHNFYGVPPAKRQWDSNYGIQFVSARHPERRPSVMSGLKSIQSAFSLAEPKDTTRNRPSSS